MTTPNSIGSNVGTAAAPALTGILTSGTTATPNRTSKTLVYAPKIDVIVSTKNGPIDISDDITNFQLRRVMNAASQFSCVLNNRKQKYTGVLGRMDPITVFLTRVKKIQAFSGFLDSVPGISLYTNTCEIQATCTLKRLMNTFWDAHLPEAQALLDQKVWDGNTAPGSEPYNGATDSGMGVMLGNVLNKVAGWDASQIFIQNIPPKFLTLFTETEDKQKQLDDIELLKKLLGISSSAASPTTGTPSAGTAPVAALDAGQYQENFDSTDIYAQFTGPFPSGDAVERWRPLAMLALKTMNIDASIIDIMMHRIGVESTGDPNAQNNTDTNAQEGHPSIGILQCIISTFNSYAVAPYNGHIRSPFGSMLASLNYVNTDPKFTGTQIEKFNSAYGGTKGY